MKRTTLVLLLVPVVAAPLAAADGPPAHGTRKRDLEWVQPTPVPPVGSSRPVRERIEGGVRSGTEPFGELAGLRAVSLAEGRAVIALAGATHAVRAGDRLASALVKAIGADRIILERSDGPGSPAMTVVVTFGPGGQARVRTYAPMNSQAPPPEVR